MSQHNKIFVTRQYSHIFIQGVFDVSTYFNYLFAYESS